MHQEAHFSVVYILSSILLMFFFSIRPYSANTKRGYFIYLLFIKLRSRLIQLISADNYEEKKMKKLYQIQYETSGLYHSD